MAAARSAPARKTAAPAKRTAAKAAPAPVEVDETEIEDSETAEVETIKEQYELRDMGRTKKGEGNQLYFNLHERGARGQIFVPLDTTAVKVLIIRDPSIVAE